MATSKKPAAVKAAAKLKVIEDTMFKSGNSCVSIWESKGDIATLRMAVATYRTSMQAMRDQSRYKTALPQKKKRTVRSKTL